MDQFGCVRVVNTTYYLKAISVSDIFNYHSMGTTFKFGQQIERQFEFTQNLKELLLIGSTRPNC